MPPFELLERAQVMAAPRLSSAELRDTLQAIGAERYHDLHPFHLDRDYVVSADGILPGTRFAVDAYVGFVRERSLLEAVASSLTEMFSPTIIAQRVEGMLANYGWITADTLAYFTPRLTQAPNDVEFALAYVDEHATSRELQEQVLAALRLKCDVLWAQLDALHLAYVDPGLIPLGAFRP